jgi:hypothetical protein
MKEMRSCRKYEDGGVKEEEIKKKAEGRGKKRKDER